MRRITTNSAPLRNETDAHRPYRHSLMWDGNTYSTKVISSYTEHMMLLLTDMSPFAQVISARGLLPGSRDAVPRLASTPAKSRALS